MGMIREKVETRLEQVRHGELFRFHGEPSHRVYAVAASVDWIPQEPGKKLVVLVADEAEFEDEANWKTAGHMLMADLTSPVDRLEWDGPPKFRVM